MIVGVAKCKKNCGRTMLFEGCFKLISSFEPENISSIYWFNNLIINQIDIGLNIEKLFYQ